MKVTLLMALTLDGKIGKDADHFPDWTGPEDKKLFVEVTKKAGCLVMGSKTFTTIGRPLPGRHNVIMTRSPKASEWDNLEFTDQHPVSIVEGLEAKGYSEVILAGGAQINTLFAQAGLIDEVIVTVCPKVFGSGIGLFNEGVELDLQLLSSENISDQVLKLHYRVKK